MATAYATVIWNPEKLKVLDPSRPTPNHPVRLPIIQTAKKGESAGKELEVLATEPLVQGSNLVKEDVLKIMETSEWWPKFVEIGAIYVVRPRKENADKLTGTTLDFSEAEAKQIVNEALDLEWLDKCISAEAACQDTSRDTDAVIECCRRRKKLIESSQRMMAAAAMKQQGDAE
jgi:hypothetical protein